MTIYRPGWRVVYPGAQGVRVVQPGGGAVTPWYLSGGIAAANCVIAYTPKGAASLAASYDNNAAPGNGLADGTYDAAPGVAPGFDTTRGWIYSGAGQLNTGYTIPVSGCSMLVRFANGSGDGNFWLCGGRVSIANGMLIWYRIAALGPGLVGYYYGNIVTLAGPTSGVAGIVGTDAYLNGVDVGNLTGSFAGVVSLTIGHSTYPLSADIVCFAFYDTILTGPQAVAVSAAMAAL